MQKPSEQTQQAQENLEQALPQQQSAAQQMRQGKQSQAQGSSQNAKQSLQRAALTDLLQELIDRGHRVTCVDVYKGWMEVDTFEDYRRAWSEIRA